MNLVASKISIEVGGPGLRHQTVTIEGAEITTGPNQGSTHGLLLAEGTITTIIVEWTLREKKLNHRTVASDLTPHLAKRRRNTEFSS